MSDPSRPDRRAATWALLGLLAAGCAGAARPGPARLESEQVEVREEIDAIKRALEAAYDRESALAERLRQAEEAGAEAREALRRQADELAAVRRLGLAPAPTVAAERQPAPLPSGGLSLRQAYPAALAAFNDHQYEVALARFAEILAAAPTSDLADNAQYWMGECHYGLGQYRQALAEFSRVFTYRGTEKDDDAQYKTARCHLALGEREEARAAYQKLLSEYPGSEYTERAREEIRSLQGP